MATEKIKSVKEVRDLCLSKITPHEGSRGSREGMTQMLNTIFGGHNTMDGYSIETNKHRYLVLIDNGQSCCESWGYVSSEDDLEYFAGAKLKEVLLVDTALNVAVLQKTGEHEYGFDGGGIQFVNFVTDRGVLQLAVYNSHNGYYGHGIVIAKDESILLSDTL